MNFSNLNLATLGKGVLVAFLSAVVGAIGASVLAGHMPELSEWLAAAKLAGLGAIAYFAKALFTKPEDNYSKFFSWNWRDGLKAMLMLFVSTLFASITAGITEGHFPGIGDLKTSALAGLTVALGYLIKNLFTNSDNDPMKKE